MSSPALPLPHSLRHYLNGDAFRGLFSHVPPELCQKVLRYGAPLGNTVEEHDRLPRCMDRLKELISVRNRSQGPLPSGTVVMARELVHGSGRFDREWHAPPGGLWLALAWADTLLPDYARLLPMATGTACCEAIRHFGVHASLKWVNDLHHEGRKLGGILCETYCGGADRDRYHLIGIGINCNNTSFPPHLRASARSMSEVLGREVPLEEFSLSLLAHLAWHFGLVHLQEEIDLAANSEVEAQRASCMVVDAWRHLSDTIGRRVIYGYDVVRHPLYRAMAEGIDSGGGLVLRLDTGEVITEYAGEIVYQATG